MKLKETKVIAIAVNKGGVGKSTITQNLGFALANKGYKTLLIDTDGQCNLSQVYDVQLDDNNIFKAIVDKDSLLNHIVNTDYENLDIVCGDERMKDIEGILAQVKFAEKRILSILKPVLDAKKYDFVLFDTPPSLGMLTTSVLCACSDVIIPLESSIFAVTGLVNMIKYVEEIKEECTDLKIMGLVLNNINRSTSMHNDIRDAINQHFPNLLFASEISQDANIRKSQMQSIPIQVFSKKTKAAIDFENLTEEIITNVKKEEK